MPVAAPVTSALFFSSSELPFQLNMFMLKS